MQQIILTNVVRCGKNTTAHNCPISDFPAFTLLYYRS